MLTQILPKKVKQTTSTIKNQLTILLDPRIYYGVFLVLFTAATMYGYYTYIRPLLTTSMGFSTQSLNWLLFIIGIMSIISNRLSGMLAEKPNSLQKVPLFYVVDILLLAVFPFALHSKIVGLAIMLILTLIVTIINSPVQIHFLNLAESEYPQSLVFASSLSSIFFNFGISLGSATASSLVGIVGLDRISIGSVVFAVLSLGSLFLINRAIKAHSSTKAGD